MNRRILSRRSGRSLRLDDWNVAHELVQCPFDRGDQIFGLERLHHVSIRTLLLSPNLSLSCPFEVQNDRNTLNRSSLSSRGRLGIRCAWASPRPTRSDPAYPTPTYLRVCRYWGRHHRMIGRLEIPFDQLQFGVRIIDHNDFAHESIPFTTIQKVCDALCRLRRRAYFIGMTMLMAPARSPSCQPSFFAPVTSRSPFDSHGS